MLFNNTTTGKRGLGKYRNASASAYRLPLFRDILAKVQRRHMVARMAQYFGRGSTHSKIPVNFSLQISVLKSATQQLSALIACPVKLLDPSSGQRNKQRRHLRILDHKSQLLGNKTFPWPDTTPFANEHMDFPKLWLTLCRRLR